MKFAARDGSTAPTLGASTHPSYRRGRGSASMPLAAASSGVAGGPMTGAVRAAGSGLDSGPADRDGPSTGRARPQRSSTVTYAKGQEVFAPGSGAGLVYIVRAGCVRLYKTLPDGRSINLGLLGPGTVFAQEDGFDGLATGASAEAMVESTLSVVAADELAGLIAESPELAAAVVAGMTRRLTELQTLVEHLLLRDTAVRLVTTLLGLAARFGRPTTGGAVAIALPLSHQGLANMIGSNRVTVTRKLLDLQATGAVRALGRNALAVDPAKLRAYVRSTETVEE